MAQHCNLGAILLLIKLSQDDTQQDKNGRRSMKPMYAEPMNVRRFKRNGRWTQICIGYIPTPNKNHRPADMAKEAWKRHKRQMFHDAMDVMLASLRAYQEHGVRMELPGRDGKLATMLVIPWVVMGSYDQPEAAYVVNKLNGYRKMHMPCSM